MTIFRPRGGGQAQGESKKVKIVELSGNVTAWGFFYTHSSSSNDGEWLPVFIKCDRQEALTSSIPLQGEVQKKQGVEKLKREEAMRIRSE